MKQQVFDFVREEITEPTVPLESHIAQELATLMAALIVAVFRAGEETADDDPAKLT